MVMSVYGYLRKVFWGLVSHRHQARACLTRLGTPMIWCDKCGNFLFFKRF